MNWFFWFKAIVAGLTTAAITEVAKSSTKVAGLLTSLPFLSALTLIWIYRDSQDLALLERYVKSALLWCIPGVFFSVSLIILFHYRVPFYWSLLSAVTLMVITSIMLDKTGWIP